MPALVEPVPPATARLLRRAVLDLALTERRRHFPTRLHVGTPGGPTVRVDDDRCWDAGLRADIAAAVLTGGSGPSATVWLTRPGSLVLQDSEADWLGPLLRSADESDVDLLYVVVTRHGWVDPRTGVRREWQRIRDRRAPATPSAAVDQSQV